ncbi:uncharacterized protein LOC144876741 [Branchiostoma floridae x Branchiostoma japonicum]
MLRVCEKLGEADAKARRLGLVRTETDYFRALLDAMANMDRCTELEVLKSLGDVNLEKGKLDKNVLRYDRAMLLYRAALLRCKDADMGESLENRYLYAEKQRVGKRGTIPVDYEYEPQTNDEKMSSPAKVAEKFLHLDRKLTFCRHNDSVLIEYTKLMVEGVINEDNLLETEAIKSFGDVYLKRGTETGDTTCLTRASALYNTALARCERVQGTVALIHRLLYTAKIRQGIQRTGNKGPKFKQGQQHKKAHLSRDFPVTSSSTDVIADAKGHKFMSPSDYISSLTPKHAPDYRSYEKHLATGDRSQADGKLDSAEREFAAALKLIHDPNKPDRCKEAECLYRLGDVYVRRGKATKEGRKFTQAAALYNAAMARTDRNKHSVTRRLQKIEQWFLRYIANVNSTSVPSNRAIHHQKRLEDMRARVKSQLQAIDQEHNPYQYEEDDSCMKSVEAERADAVKALFKNIAQDRQFFIHDLVDECFAQLGRPPCKYALIGLGSQATELVTPYSDLEFAILIEDGKDNDVTRQYFINLAHYLHLKVINLGETILPAMAIPSLNDFQSENPEKDWFFDTVTPRGFAFDGFMPWASKTPFGRDKTKSKPRVSLIQTPSEMAKFQRLDVSVSEGYHLSDILRRVVLLTGEDALMNEYRRKLSEIITDDLLSRLKSHLSAIQILFDDKEHFFPNYEPTGQLLNVKKDIYRFPGIAIELLALCCQITLSSAWDVIDKLQETGKIGEENATHLTVLTSISAELRLRTYMANGGQKDSISPLTQMKYQSETHEVPDSILRSVFYIPDTKVLFRYYCRAIPLKKCMPATVKDSWRVQSTGIFNTTIYDASNECLGQIARYLLLSTSKRYLEAALKDTGSDTIKRSQILRELGDYWASQSDGKNAISYYEQTITMLETIHGDNMAHPVIAHSLQGLGLSWSEVGNEKKAISYYKQSLAMMKAIYGDDTAHPSVAQLIDNLASSWSNLGDEKKAISYYEQSLMMMKLLYGDNTAHRSIAGSLHNLGTSWGSLGDQKKKISYSEQSLTMMKTLYGDNTAHPDIANSLLSLGSSWSELGDEEKAISYFEQSLTMRKAIYGDNTAHPHIAKSLLNLGTSWSELGDPKKAMSYFEQSLTMMKTFYRDNKAHPDIADSLQGLGTSSCELGDHKKAIGYFEQSLTMQKAIYGENTAHPSIARSLSNLGLSWSELGNQQKSINYYNLSLRMMKTIYRDNTAHPDIADSLNNMGLSSVELGDQKKAIIYFEQSLTMRKAIYGDNTAHPNTAQSLFNLGTSWSRLGDQKKAIRYFEQSLIMRKTIFGDNRAHQSIAQTLHNLGTSWSIHRDQKKAILYLEQSLAMMKTLCGDNTPHPGIARSLNNLGLSWSRIGDQKKAVSYFEQSLTTAKAIYGDNTAHPSISQTVHNLGLSWSELGDPKKAISYYEQSLTMSKIIYGDNTAHPSIAASLHGLGSSWSELGDQKKSISYFEQMLTMTKTIYGHNTAHPSIAASLQGLGSSWSELGDQKKSIGYFEQILTMTKTIYGHNTAHPDIARSLHNLGSSWGRLGDQEKAISFYEQSLTMTKTLYGAHTAHPSIAASLHGLGTCWRGLGDQKKAISYRERALRMMKTLHGDNVPHPFTTLQRLGSYWGDLGNEKKEDS